MVPVLRNVEGKNYAHIEKALSELGEKVRLTTYNIRSIFQCFVRYRVTCKFRCGA